MATETSSAPVNGNYAPHAGYGGVDQQQNNYAYAPPTNAAVSNPPASTQTPPVGGSSQQADIPKDEVGWYFVEQYYTTLSKSPEKLYLFYSKRSQFVSGDETDKVPVCVGQRAINDRIKELDFQECKVRVTNVDSQASDSNIVIQVIGEISNKSQPHKKFTQTFVLATQTNGYFVLNDIFRYLIEEEEETGAEAEAEPGVAEATRVPEPTESQPSEPASKAAEPKTLTTSAEPAAVEQSAQAVDEEIEQKVLKDEQPPVQEAGINGSSQVEEQSIEEETPAAPAITTEDASTAAASSSVDENQQPDKPKSPEPSPVQTPAKAPTPEPAPAPKPAAPQTWASLAASANKVATPVTASAPSPTSQSKPSTSAKPAAPTSTTPTTSAAPATTAPQAAPSALAAQRDESSADGSQGDEWTAVSSSHNRQHSKVTQQYQEASNSRGFIKNVNSNVIPEDLKAAIDAVAEVTYFDVAHEKNCAFVDFRSPEAFNAAVAASPFTVNGERLWVMQRYTKNNNPGFTRGGFQNNRGRGGMNQGQPRGNYQGRGGFPQPFRGPPRERGGASPRGRGGQGMSQAT